MPPIFYTVTAIQGDYADLISDGGQPHSVTMFLLPEGVTVGQPAEAGKFSVEALTGIEAKNPRPVGRGFLMKLRLLLRRQMPISRRSG